MSDTPCTHTTKTKAAIEKHIQQAHELSNPSNYYGYKWLTRLPVTSLQEPCVHTPHVSNYLLKDHAPYLSLLPHKKEAPKKSALLT